ncbi:phage holin family protein, partial [uncultured Corynebacterium sp.]
IMIALAGILALVGVKSLKKIRAPKKTIDSVNELKNLRPGQAQKNLAKDSSGLYTGSN